MHIIMLQAIAAPEPDRHLLSCPACGSTALEKQMALPAIKTSGTHAKSLQAAKRRDKAQGAERMHAQRQYELNHDD